MRGMMAEFPNDWEEVQETPIHRFIQAPAEEVLNRASSWDLPSNVHSIIRWQCSTTGRVHEKVCRTSSASNKKCRDLSNKGDRFTVMYQEQMKSNY